MKKLLLTAVFTFFAAMQAQAQSINFEYDIAGNQIKRKYLFLDTTRLVNQNVKKTSELKQEDLIKFFPEDVISYYPNPVKEELFLKWELTDNNKVTTIAVFNLNGQLVNNYTEGFETNTQTLSFVTYPLGVYFVNLNYKNGDTKSIKIVKE